MEGFFFLELGCEDCAVIILGEIVSWKAVRVILMVLVGQKLDEISRLGLVIKTPLLCCCEERDSEWRQQTADPSALSWKERKT